MKLLLDGYKKILNYRDENGFKSIDIIDDDKLGQIIDFQCDFDTSNYFEDYKDIVESIFGLVTIRQFGHMTEETYTSIILSFLNDSYFYEDTEGKINKI